ncbi:MAG: dimethylargininase [Acidobacteria bacterium]|nr:dimethylargininase [Acidobacteriota bacterium]
MPVAITRQVSAAIGGCELTHLPRVQIDVGRARAQHGAYEQALAAQGCQVISLPSQPAMPDSVFVEDAAIVLDEIAIVTRPGVPSRRCETLSVAEALTPYRRIRFVEAPGTVEGGDVLRLGHRLFVGLSGRSNQSGIMQLRAVVWPCGYTVTPVPVAGCLHLKSAVTQVADRTLLVNPKWVDASIFGQWTVIDVDPDEPYAANGLLIGDRVIYPSSFPRTRDRLEAHGIAVVPVDVSELQKAEGAVTCCSLIFAFTASERP